MKKDTALVEILKKYTNIDTDFIDTFFGKFKTGKDTDFHIKDTDAAKYLGIKLSSLRKRLNNGKYEETIDYIKIKDNKSTTYMLNYKCFERLAMQGDSAESEAIRMYFVKLREFLVNNQHVLYQAMGNKSGSNKKTLYFFAIGANKSNMLKENIVGKLRKYNVGQIEDSHLKYYVMVRDPVLIETLAKMVVENGKTIYSLDKAELKKIVHNTVCKNIDKKNNNRLLRELADLTKMYGYVKDRADVKSYVVMG